MGNFGRIGPGKKHFSWLPMLFCYTILEESERSEAFVSVPQEKFANFTLFELGNSIFHCVKSVQICSCFQSVISCIHSENRKIRTRNKYIFGHLQFLQYLQFLEFKLTQSCHKNMDIFPWKCISKNYFWKLFNSIICWLPLYYIHIMSKRLKTQSGKI